MRKKQHIADGRRVGEQHDQAVDADAHAARRRHAVLERADVVGVVAHGLSSPMPFASTCARETLGLINRVVELGEGVGVLMTHDEQLETLRELRVVGLLLRQRGHLERVIDDERQLDDLLLGDGLGRSRR